MLGLLICEMAMTHPALPASQGRCRAQQSQQARKHFRYSQVISEIKVISVPITYWPFSVFLVPHEYLHPCGLTEHQFVSSANMTILSQIQHPVETKHKRIKNKMGKEHRSSFKADFRDPLV